MQPPPSRPSQPPVSEFSFSLLPAGTRERHEIGAKTGELGARIVERQGRSAPMADSRGEVTVLLGELKLGRKDALERLMPLVYRDLRRSRPERESGTKSGPKREN